jgi:hypothetical protein
MQNVAGGISTAQNIALDDFNGDRTERVIVAAVKIAVMFWCLPFLVLAYLVTWFSIAVWRVALLTETFVWWLIGSTPPSHPASSMRCLAMAHTGTLAFRQTRHELSRSR